jgi:hypothetical protein
MRMLSDVEDGIHGITSMCISHDVHRVVFSASRVVPKGVFSNVFVFAFFIRLANLFFRRSLRDVYGTSKANDFLSFYQY